MKAGANENNAAENRPKPLKGVKVLDMSRVLAGPWVSQMLADYGADVLKIERPQTGDDTRTWGPPWWGDGDKKTAAYFICANRGKRSVAIDISSEVGIAKIKELVQEADILIENYKVGQLAKYGLDAKSLMAINPKLIYCSITGYGQTGPQAKKAGYDFAIQAEGGLMSITGQKDEEPQKVGVAVVDIMTGLYAANAIMACLFEREKTQKGRYIDAALFDVQIAMLANQASNQLIGGITPTRMGNAHPNIVPYQVFPTKDGHMVLAIGNDGQFAKFCKAIGVPEMANSEKYNTNPERVKNRVNLIEIIRYFTVERNTEEWVDLLDNMAVPCTPINNIKQVLEHKQTKARKMIIENKNEEAPPMIANPIMIDGQRIYSENPPPELDEDEPEWLGE